MIDRNEIDQKSVELGVHSSDVQRDYVFGWLLAGNRATKIATDDNFEKQRELV